MNKHQFTERLFYIIQEKSSTPAPKPGPTPIPVEIVPPKEKKMGKMGKIASYIRATGKLGRPLQTYAFLDMATGEGSLAKATITKFKDFGDVFSGRATFMGVGPYNPNSGTKRV